MSQLKATARGWAGQEGLPCHSPPPALTLLPSSLSNRRMIWMESTLWPLQRKLTLVRKEHWSGLGEVGVFVGS